jgi:hypothetical protein
VIWCILPKALYKKTNFGTLPEKMHKHAFLPIMNKIRPI